MTEGMRFIGTATLGAGLMYLLDPVSGRRRRALMEDKAISFLQQFGDDIIGPTVRDLSNRVRGLIAETSALVQSNNTPDDEILVARVRSEMGRVVSHPGSIEVTVNQGHVTLSGPVLAEEEKRLLRHVAAVQGVREVENHLEVHQQADDVPGLQGGTHREPRFALLQTNWSPTARLLTGVTGGMLTYWGAQRRDLPGVVVAGVGLSMLARGLTNMEMERLVGVGSDHRGVDIQKTINIMAPVERVFAIWANYEYFPYFMSHVQGVRDLGNGHSHWVVAGPAGVPVEWDAVMTEYVPNEILAWKSESGATVQHVGVIRFESNPDNSTRVHVRLSYRPPAGVAGHVIAKLFRTDPKQQMDADLLRMKTFIETGTPPHDAAQPAH